MKPVLTFPYHDPAAIYNGKFKLALPKLREIFEQICISVTPPTWKENAEFIDFLEKEGFSVFKNPVESNIGDHYRNALRLGLESGSQRVFVSFIGRFLYAVLNGYEEEFTRDVTKSSADFVVYERSEAAWETHPKVYREMELIVKKIGGFLMGKEIELLACGFSFQADLGKRILEQSIDDSYSTGAEWVLQAALMGVTPEIIKCDWLKWEDPFIDGVDADVLKKEREQDQKDTLKRIKMCAPVFNLLNEKRFYPLLGE